MKSTRSRIASASLAACVVLAGCTADSAGEDSAGVDNGVTTTTQGTTETTSATTTTSAGGDTTTTTTGNGGAIDSAEAIAKLQTSLDALEAQMEGVADEDDLRTAWAEIETRVRDAVTGFQADADFDEAALEEQLDTFETELESADLGAEAEDAWSELREAVRELVGSLES